MSETQSTATPAHTQETEQAYQALVKGAAVQLRPDAGALVLQGADRVDFLQRMTTNNIAVLRDHGAVVTVLTSPTARILFVFTVLHRPDDLLLLPARAQTEALARHLRSQIFFMDQVQVQDVSADYRRMRIMGQRAASALAQLGFNPEAMQDSTWQDDEWQEHEEQIALKQDRYDVPGYELLVPIDQESEVISQFQAAGAVILQDDHAYNTRRIELGRAVTGRELTEDYTPLETGLAWTCAENKGCYTGQEIIARQITYDKVTRLLVGLQSSELLAPGDTVTGDDGRKAGEVTSAAYSPALGAPIALAVLRRDYAEPDTNVTVGEHSAQVRPLPFTQD